MDYEKAYKDALERARLSRLQLLDIGEEATEIEYIFPELNESADEKIRKELLAFLKENLEKGGDLMTAGHCLFYDQISYMGNWQRPNSSTEARAFPISALSTETSVYGPSRMPNDGDVLAFYSEYKGNKNGTGWHN